VAGRIENLKPWPKGVSGNPGGRPKRDMAAEIAQAVFENNPDAIYRGMLRALKKGNPRVFAVLADRAYGKVNRQPDADANSNEEYIAMLEAAFRRDLKNMSDEELQRQVDAIDDQLWPKQLIPGQ